MKHNLAILAIFAEIRVHRDVIQNLQSDIIRLHPCDRRDRYERLLAQRRAMIGELRSSIKVLKKDK